MRRIDPDDLEQPFAKDPSDEEFLEQLNLTLAPRAEADYLELDGDYDLCGDGSVMVITTPGHTLGHQSVKVKLPSGKTYVMTQDAVWVKENLEGYPAGINYSVKDYEASIQRLKMIRDLENAELLFGHDPDQFAQGGNKWHR